MVNRGEVRELIFAERGDMLQDRAGGASFRSELQAQRDGERPDAVRRIHVVFAEAPEELGAKEART